MWVRTFDRIEDATDYLNNSSFTYPDEVSSYDGKSVLKLFKLISEESERFRRISSSYSWASFKEAGISTIKSMGADAAGTLYHAGKGNLFGALKSYFSMVTNTGGSGSDAEERLAAQNPDNAVYSDFERAYISRQLFVYQYVKSTFPSRQARVASRKIGSEDGCVLFMYKI